MRSGKSVSILGIRGIPARHGGFETFAEVLALYLQGNGWDVTVYCQAEGRDQRQESQWQGIRLVTISTRYFGGFFQTQNVSLASLTYELLKI